MADWFASRLSSTNSRRPLVIGAVTAVCLIGLAGTAAGWIRAIPAALLPARVATDARLRSDVQPYLAFADVIAPTDIVVADPSISLVVGAVSGKVVSVVTPVPFVADAKQRADDAASILDPRASWDKRSSLLNRYEVEWLVVPAAEAVVLLAATPGAKQRSAVAGYAVIKLGH